MIWILAGKGGALDAVRQTTPLRASALKITKEIRIENKNDQSYDGFVCAATRR
jgi:hypothetical protein